MEALLNVQNYLSKSIEKAFINFKKSPKERLTSFYVEAKLENLEKDWLLFRDNNSKLYVTYSTDDLEESTYVKKDIYEQTEESYSICRAHMKLTLKSLSPQPIISVNESDVSKSSSVRSTSLAKLPKISIPVFSGKYEEWTTFRDLFISLVHKNSSLDNVQKIHYLKAHLTGEAEQLIRHTPIADSNYERCWELLDKRYNNKKFLSNSILNKLFKQRAIHVESASALKDLLDTSTDCLNALRCLGIDVSTWDIIVIHIVSSKLDPETRKQWELIISSPDKDQNELPTFEQLQAFMESRFRALEFVEPSKVQRASSGYKSTPRSFVATEESSASSPMPCEYCAESHKLTFCKKFQEKDTNSRKEFVVKHRMCFNCLGSNHSVYNCKKPTTCRICHRRHHTLLHVSMDVNAKEKEEPNDFEVKDSSDVTSTPIVSCLSTGQVAINKQVLLATALVQAEAKYGAYQTVRALLDQGSQACFITEDTVQRLRLTKIPVNGKISGLGNEQTNIKTSHVVHTTIKSLINPQFQMKITAYVLKNITTYQLEREMNLLKWIELEKLSLADPTYNSPQRIDMLLGADVYGHIMNEGVKKSPSGTLVAQNTSLGWILSGTVQAMGPENSTTNITFAFDAHCTDTNLQKKFENIKEQMQSQSGKVEQRNEVYIIQTKKKSKSKKRKVNLPCPEQAALCNNENSSSAAVNKSKLLEKSMRSNSTFQSKETQYKQIINKYIPLDVMRQVEESDETRYENLLEQLTVVKNNKKNTDGELLKLKRKCKNKNKDKQSQNKIGQNKIKKKQNNLEQSKNERKQSKIEQIKNKISQNRIEEETRQYEIVQDVDETGKYKRPQNDIKEEFEINKTRVKIKRE